MHGASAANFPLRSTPTCTSPASSSQSSYTIKLQNGLTSARDLPVLFVNPVDLLETCLFFINSRGMYSVALELMVYAVCASLVTLSLNAGSDKSAAAPHYLSAISNTVTVKLMILVLRALCLS